jgi:translocation and assembly module TamA
MRASWMLLVATALCLVAETAVATSPVDIRIEGVEGEVRDNVRGHLSVQRYREEVISEARLRRLHARAPSEIRRALQPFGHYRPEIETELEQLDDGWRAVYRIRPGPRVRLVAVTVRVEGEGEHDGVFQRTLRELPLREDQPLNHQDYEESKFELQQVAARRGYLEARFEESSLRVDPELGIAEARLIMQTGPRYRYGEVTIHQTILRDDFVRRYLTFDQGDPYDGDDLLSLQFALADSDYFSFAEVRPRRDLAAELEIPVEIDTAPTAKHRYTAGLGYGTDTGPRATARWDYRRINQRGHRGAMATHYSGIRKSVETRYVVPLERPARERLTYSWNAIREDRGDAQSRRQELGLARTTIERRWQQTLFTQFERERSILPDRDQLSEIVVGGVNWSRTRTDDPALARRGTFVSLDLRGAREELFSDLNFAQARLDAKRVQPLGERNRLLVRLSLGGTGTDDFDLLPVSQRFFAGGDRTVRGFGYEQLSPRDEDGNRVGGRYLAVGSVELDRRLRGQWYGALFVDTGNAMMSFSESLETSAGVGMRWGTPIGMIRLDFARPVDHPDLGWRIHLSVGPDL